jgi:hypothetical protein
MLHLIAFHMQRARKMWHLSIEAMVRGYNVYSERLDCSVGEEFPCTREVTYMFDPFAVAVMRGDAVIG